MRPHNSSERAGSKKGAGLSLAERIARARELGCAFTEYPHGNNKVALVYGRVSGGKQATDSIYANQRQRGMANKAASLQYSAVINVFADLAGVSGALGPEHRPGFRLVCQLIEEGIVDVVFVMDFTRLVRDKVIGLDFATLCIQSSVTIIDETGRTLDPSDKVGLILYVVQLSESVEERSRINFRLQISRHKKAELGRDPGKSINVGFYIDPRLSKQDPNYHRWLPYEPHTGFVRLVLNTALKVGRSPSKIYQACQAAGLTTLPKFEDQVVREYMEKRTGLRRTRRDQSDDYIVSKTLIKSILDNYEFYMGIFKWGKENSPWGTAIRIENNHTPIVDPVYHSEFQLLASLGKRHPQRAKSALPFSGLIYSLNNGLEPTPAQGLTGKIGYYADIWEYNHGRSDQTRWNIRRSVLEGPICEVIFARLKLPDYSEQVAAKLDHNRQEATEKIERLRASQARLEAEIENLNEGFAYTNTPKGRSDLQQNITKRQQQLHELEKRVQESIVSKDWEEDQTRLEDYRALLSNIPLLWETASDPMRNRFLQLILKAVHIDYQGTYFDATIIWFNGEEDHIRVHIPVPYRSKQDWTAEERDYLEANYVSAPWHELTTKLGRSERAIYVYAECTLGLRKLEGKHQRGKNALWTPEEKSAIVEYMQSEMSYEDLRLALPDRTEEAITSRLRDLGQAGHPTKPYWHYLPDSSGVSLPSSRIARKSKAAPPAQ
jgi:DNA invertase Pin-like site-specific DNA recombinase